MKLYLILFLVLQTCVCQQKATPDQPKQPENSFDIEKSVVSDNSSLFTPAQKETLVERLIAYDTETTNQIVVITVDSITPLYRYSKICHRPCQ